MNYRIPLTNPHAQYLSYKSQIDEAVKEVLSSGTYLMGKQSLLFENEFGEYLGVKNCITVGNGTDAIAIALMACGIQPGDEVITVSHTAVATVAAIVQIGAIPVWADIDTDSRCIKVSAIPSLISTKTKAIVPVHIYGQMADMPLIMKLAEKYGLKVIEDCAQATGASLNGMKAGTYGHAAAFSFYPTKNLASLGDGGMVVSNNDDIAGKASLIKQYGWDENRISQRDGVNSRLDELQASILRVKLTYLDADNSRRHEIAAMYKSAFEGTKIKCPKEIEDSVHAMHLFVAESERWRSLCNHLNLKGIATGRHYPQPVHMQPAFFNKYRGCDQLKNTEAFYMVHFSLPMYPEMPDHDIQYIIESIKNWQ